MSGHGSSHWGEGTVLLSINNFTIGDKTFVLFLCFPFGFAIGFPSAGRGCKENCNSIGNFSLPTGVCLWRPLDSASGPRLRIFALKRRDRASVN